MKRPKQHKAFIKSIKKLYKNEEIAMEKAVLEIIQNSQVGNRKKGVLKNIWVYKYKVK